MVRVIGRVVRPKVLRLVARRGSTYDYPFPHGDRVDGRETTRR